MQFLNRKNELKAEQEENKKLQSQIQEMRKKMQELIDDHKQEISKIKKVCYWSDSIRQPRKITKFFLATLVRNSRDGKENSRFER